MNNAVQAYNLISSYLPLSIYFCGYVCRVERISLTIQKMGGCHEMVGILDKQKVMLSSKTQGKMENESSRAFWS